MIDLRATVKEMLPQGGDCWLAKIDCPQIAALFQPGQFVMVKAWPGNDPLLRRPLGILKAEAGDIFLYFQVIGRGTALLAAMEPGREIQLLGPLGRPFPRPESGLTLLIAGGRGIVPLLAAARAWAEFMPLHFIYGARRGVDLHLADELQSLPLAGLHLYSEDGGRGRIGLVSCGLEEILAEHAPQSTFSCGPEAMLNALAGLLKQQPGRHYFSLEALMGCGFGACYGCAAAQPGAYYARVCVDGPVFALEELQWPI